MNTNVKLTIEYDGSLFCGWQRQKKEMTIQGEIEKVLAIMTEQKVVLMGSGRTDAGVHALGQVANFHCDSRLAPEVFHKGLNALLPEGIVVKTCERVPDSFHARYDAKSKIYQYRILNRLIPVAVGRQYVWHIKTKLDAGAMQRAIRHIVGTHDFKAFEGAGSPRATTTRQVVNARLTRDHPDDLVFEIEAEGFLRYMVRNIVGTLVDVGRLKISPEDFKAILQSMDRGRAGATAPPQGLFLMAVKYE
jgi:tRNA pseudouridine38-40 synthase